MVVADDKTIKVYGYSYDIDPDNQSTQSEYTKPVLVAKYNFDLCEEEDEEQLTFVSFLSDLDPSLLLALSFSKSKNCSYIKVLKIYSK